MMRRPLNEFVQRYVSQVPVHALCHNTVHDSLLINAATKPHSHRGTIHVHTIMSGAIPGSSKVVKQAILQNTWSSKPPASHPLSGPTTLDEGHIRML
eukprot:COSAG02_NODE_1743_length_11100_cov_17.677575_15_plen_97_part_00